MPKGRRSWRLLLLLLFLLSFDMAHVRAYYVQVSLCWYAIHYQWSQTLLLDRFFTSLFLSLSLPTDVEFRLHRWLGWKNKTWHDANYDEKSSFSALPKTNPYTICYARSYSCIEAMVYHAWFSFRSRLENRKWWKLKLCRITKMYSNISINFHLKFFANGVWFQHQKIVL